MVLAVAEEPSRPEGQAVILILVTQMASQDHLGKAELALELARAMAEAGSSEAVGGHRNIQEEEDLLTSSIPLSPTRKAFNLETARSTFRSLLFLLQPVRPVSTLLLPPLLMSVPPVLLAPIPSMQDPSFVRHVLSALILPL